MNALRSPVLLILCLSLAACHEEPPVRGPLRQEAYVWQREWSPAVRDSIGQARDLAGLAVLAAEVDLRPRTPSVIRIPLDAATLKSYGRPVGATLRVHAFPGRFVDDPRMVDSLRNLVRDVAAEAKVKGLSLAEIQMDYDCPEWKLDDYRVLLVSLRQSVAPVPLTFTALPVWLYQHRAFRKLIDAVDGYVLQVHSLQPPQSPTEPIVLAEPRSARAWVERAAQFGKPFRVALPTYSYQVAFDAKGKLIGLMAEGPFVTFGDGITVRSASSDPQAMAGLVRGWTEGHPKELTGILWYRLPVAGDRNNWTWPTLRAVMAGQAPKPGLHAETRRPEPGLVEIDLVNGGDAESPWPPAVQVRWKDGAFLAADALAGYAMQRQSAREVQLGKAGAARNRTLHPGDRRMVAWLRFKAPTEVQVELPQPQPVG